MMSYCSMRIAVITNNLSRTKEKYPYAEKFIFTEDQLTGISYPTWDILIDIYDNHRFLPSKVFTMYEEFKRLKSIYIENTRKVKYGNY